MCGKTQKETELDKKEDTAMSDNLTLSQRIKVASAIHAGMELEPAEIKYLHEALRELRRRTIEDGDDAVFLYQQKVLKAERSKYMQTVAVIGIIFLVINGALLWLT
jgi:tmRNA-binding protein